MKEKEAYDFSRQVLRYLKKELAKEEEHVFLDSVSKDAERKRILEAYQDNRQLARDLEFYQRVDTESAWEKMMSKKANPGFQPESAGSSNYFGLRKWLPYAAVLFCIAGFGLWSVLGDSDERLVVDNNFGYANDVLALPNSASLKLASGEEVSLGQTAGVVKEGTADLYYSEKGELAYRSKSHPGQEQFHEIVVSNAGKFRLRLSDGSVVWVSSLSKLRYPVAFKASERRVSLEGEAYFEIAKDAKRPFYVEVGDKTVRVLGTRFNVSAYGRQVRTTLVEGSVRIEDGNSVSMLKPGQQAVFESGPVLIQPANVKRDLAWKEGYFSFERDSIKTIMDKIARWYDVSVTYDHVVRHEVYTGSVPKASSLGGVLQALTDVSGLDFEINGRTVSVK